MRLDRYLAKQLRQPNRELRRAIESGAVSVAGQITINPALDIDRFMPVTYAGELLAHEVAEYWMLHKPAGWLSATSDAVQPVVTELLPTDTVMHIAGRLDKNATGLLLLSNNGLWTKALMHPDRQQSKTYRVECREPIPTEAAGMFAKGVYFAREQLTTRPAELELLAPTMARLVIYEGRYHQIKRMFARLGVTVTQIHREAIGTLRLDEKLALGEARPLTPTEQQSILE